MFRSEKRANPGTESVQDADGRLLNTWSLNLTCCWAEKRPDVNMTGSDGVLMVILLCLCVDDILIVSLS